MKYFVTGATGFIGTNVIEQLVADDHDVIALTRSRSNADHLPNEVTVAEGDIMDKESMREPMTGVDGVFHMAAWFFIGPGPRNRENAERTNVEGTRNVLELMGELNVPKGVYTSTIGVFGDTGGKTVDETHRPEPPGLCVYFQTKWRAHYEVARPLIDDGLPLVIVLPGGVFGPGDKEYGSVRAPFYNWLQGDLPILPRRLVLSFDYVEDTARAHIRAMEDGTPGEEYIIAREPRNIIDLFNHAEEMTRVSAPRTVSPLWFALLAKVLTPIERIGTPPEGLEPEMLRTYGGTEIRVDNSKAKRELGVEHRPLVEGLRDYLQWELAQQEIETKTEQRKGREPPSELVP